MERREFLASALATGALTTADRSPMIPGQPSVRRPFHPTDARRLRFVRDAGFFRNGRIGYYSVAAIDDASVERHTLWVFNHDGSGTRQVGRELADLSAPSPSPDGKWLAVLTEVDWKRQLYLVPVEGGPARPLTKLPQGVAGRAAWSPDGRSIAFAAGPARRRDPSLPYRLDRVTYRFDGLGYLDDVVTDIHVVDIESGSARQLTSDRSMHSEPQWSPDGRMLAYLVSFPPDREWSFLPELHLLDVERGPSRAVVGAWGGVFSYRWCDDGTRIAFVGGPALTGFFATRKSDLWVVDVSGGEPVCRTNNLLAGVGSLIQSDLPVYPEMTTTRIAIDRDAAYLSGQRGGDVVVYRIKLSGPESVELAVEREHSAYFVDFAPESGVLYRATSFGDPPELRLGATAITALNRDVLATIARPEVRTLRVTAPDGLATDAWAMIPTGTGPWPTILAIHGGPYGAFGSTYVIDFQALVGAGFAVVFGNFRGSAGYGSEFSQRIVGRWGTAGSLDHHATLDEAIKLGIADRERLGVCGLSHGGFATCWLVGTSNRFKAAVAENPVTNFARAFGEMDAGWWIATELGGRPNEIPEVYRERSPLTYASSCKTPVLFVVGEADMRCHPVEAEQYHRVLKTNGVATEILRLPNSSHIGSAIGPVAGRMAQNEALVQWFTRYLGPR